MWLERSPMLKARLKSKQNKKAQALIPESSYWHQVLEAEVVKEQSKNTITIIYGNAKVLLISWYH